MKTQTHCPRCGQNLDPRFRACSCVEPNADPIPLHERELPELGHPEFGRILQAKMDAAGITVLQLVDMLRRHK